PEKRQPTTPRPARHCPVLPANPCPEALVIAMRATAEGNEARDPAGHHHPPAGRIPRVFALARMSAPILIVRVVGRANLITSASAMFGDFSSFAALMISILPSPSRVLNRTWLSSDASSRYRGIAFVLIEMISCGSH